MGGIAPNIIHSVEESTGTAIKQGVENWFTTSGKKFLSELGPPGKFLAEHLQHYEAYKAGTASRSKALIEQIHTDPQRLANVKNTFIAKLRQSGTPVNTLRVTEPFVYHPDLGKANSALRKQAIAEIRTKTNFTQRQAEDTINKLLTDQNTRSAAVNMLDPVFPLKTGLLPTKERYMKWGDAVANRVADNLFFGPQDRNLAAIIHTIKESRGRVSATNAADFLDIYLHNTAPSSYREGLKQQSAYRPANEAEKLINKLSSYMFTSRIAIPHAAQWANTVVNSGLKPTFQAIFEMINSPQAARDFVISSGALDEELRRELEISIRGGESTFDKILHHPGFSWVRKQEIKFSAITGKHEALDAAQQLLKNSNDKAAATTLGKLGINPNDVIQSKGLTPEMERTAGYYAANRDMFFTSTLNTPFRWSGTPAARIRSQYKPFSFNMTRMIKETLQKDIESGATYSEKIWNVSKTLGVLGTLFPVVGEIVSLVENQALGRQDNPFETDTPFNDKWKHDHAFLDQYINAIAHVGGFGIAYSMFRAAKRRMISNFFLGPVESSLYDMAGDFAKGIVSGDFKPFARDIMRKIPLVGPGVTRQVLPPSKRDEGVPRRQRINKK